MAKYINADKLKKQIDREIFRHDTIDHVFQIMDEFPGIGIVFCKECKHWNDNDEYCEYVVRGHTDYDDFCSYGERKE